VCEGVGEQIDSKGKKAQSCEAGETAKSPVESSSDDQWNRRAHGLILREALLGRRGLRKAEKIEILEDWR
jgi:hypothetical protein